MRHLFLQFAAAAALTALSIINAHAHGETSAGSAECESAVHATAAHDHRAGQAIVAAGDIEISAAWARAMLPNQPAGGGYLTVANEGREADRLVGASSPVAGKVEIHAMEVVNDVMTMRPVEDGLEIPAGTVVELKPGGLHVMFMEVSQPFREGDTVPVTLEFERAGKVEIALPVKAAQGGGHHDH